MYIITLGQLPYQSEAAARQAAQELFTKYELDCRGIDVLRRLRKEKHTAYDEALLHRRPLKGSE